MNKIILIILILIPILLYFGVVFIQCYFDIKNLEWNRIKNMMNPEDRIYHIQRRLKLQNNRIDWLKKHIDIFYIVLAISVASIYLVGVYVIIIKLWR